jgi:hypothetical protein
MQAAALLLIGLAGVGGVSEYARGLDARALDQAAFDSETYGEKKALTRVEDGLRISLDPGAEETGWKAPQALKIGGDFTITASLVVNKLPKPAQEDGAAVGIAIAQGDINQPDLTFVRLREPAGADVYRAIEKAGAHPGQPMEMGGPMMMMMPGQPNPKNAKPARHVFPANADAVQLELRREKNVIRFQVIEGKTGRARYLGQTTLGPGDISGVKLFVSNRNGGDKLEAVWRDVTIRADRLGGLGTTVRTVFNNVVYADPTAIEKGILIVGGPPKNPPPAPGAAKDAKNPAQNPAATPSEPANKPKEAEQPKEQAAAAPAAPAAAPAPAPAAAPAVAQAAPPAAAPGPAAPVQASPSPSQPGAAAPEKKEDAKPKEPKAKIPLDEVETIRFERTPALAARFLGQRNVDFTGPAPDAKKEDEKPKDADAKGKGDTKDAPKKDESKKDGVKPDEAKKDEAKGVDAKKEEPKKDEAKNEAQADEVKEDKSKSDEPKKDEAKKDEANKDAPKKDEANKDAPEKDEAKKDGANKDAPKKDEAKKDEANKDEPKKDESKKDEAKKDGAKKDEAKPKEKPKPKDKSKDESASAEVTAPLPGTVSNKIARVEPEKNGIRDVCLALSGLRSAKIKQVTVTCQTDKGASSWRLDTSDSHDWPLVVRRSGNEGWAELYLEPPASDTFEKEYQINLVYEDGQNGNTKIKATEHTDAKRAFDKKEPEAVPLGATVYLTGDEKIFGLLEQLNADALRLGSPWTDQPPLEIPLARVVGVQLSVEDRKESPESFAKRLKSRSSEDLLLARTKDGEVLAIPEIVEGIEADRLQFRYQDKIRTLPLAQVEGWVMAARPDPKPSDRLLARLSLVSGLSISGVWKDLDTQTWTLESPWGQVLKVPAAEVQDVRFRGGLMTYLSDLQPSEVEETPFFGHKMPWRRDVSLSGGPLRMNGQTYERGIAVHSRSRLTYDLNGRFGRFEAAVGFDEAARGKGRVDCRVVADGKPIFTKTDLRADEPPVALSLPVAGVTQLRLEVDYGPGQDTGDRVIWANARLYRPKPSSAGAEAHAAASEGAK